jgi:hypothetical protein
MVKGDVVSPLSQKVGSYSLVQRGESVAVEVSAPIQVPRKYQAVLHDVNYVQQGAYLLGPFPNEGLVLGQARAKKGLKISTTIRRSLASLVNLVLVMYDMECPPDSRIEGVRNQFGVPMAFAVITDSKNQKKAAKA